MKFEIDPDIRVANPRPAPRIAAVLAGGICFLSGALIAVVGGVVPFLGNTAGRELLSNLVISGMLTSLGSIAALIGFRVLRGKSLFSRTVGWWAGATVVITLGAIAPVATNPPGAAIDPVHQLGYMALLAAVSAGLYYRVKRASRRRDE